jgi:release factor glutamine methyltransferase
LYQYLLRELTKIGSQEAESEARIVFRELFKQPVHQLFLAKDQPTQANIQLVNELVKRRSLHEPLQYIIGHTWFREVKIKVNPDVLIPRQETELLIDHLVKAAVHQNRVLEIGVGSGGPLVALLSECPNLTAVGTDISKKALVVAQANIDEHQLTHRCNLIQADLYHGEELFSLVYSNPPYIEEKTLVDLQQEVQQEPRLALDGGETGLTIIERLLSRHQEILFPGGQLFLEIGWNQARAVSDLAKKYGLRCKGIWQDYSGQDRIVLLEA